MNDHDGKSKTSAAVDAAHYPSPEDDNLSTASPTQTEIAARAHELWVLEGKPAGSAERHWMEAERELKNATQSRSLIDQVYSHSGSVQN